NGAAPAITAASPSTSELVIFALIAVILVRRIYLMQAGSRVSSGRLFAFTGLYVALFALTIGTTVALLPLYGTVADLIVLAVSAALVLPHTRGAVRFDRRPDGYWYYRVGSAIIVSYVVLLLVRWGVEFGLLGIDPLVYPPPISSLTAFQVGLLEVVDLLFAVSTGLLLGRNLGVYLAFLRRPPEPASPGPLPSHPRP
ncbi:MAG: hypothetical protein ACRECR_06365, partial [Thermoplasmata archaeon]